MNAYRSPWMTEDHDMYRDGVRKFLESEFLPQREHWVEQGYPEKEYWKKAG